MKNIFKITLAILLALQIFSCKKNILPAPIFPDYSNNYKYYPIKEGRIWNYNLITEDNFTGKIDTFDYKGIYSSDSGCTNFFRNGAFYGMTYWTNYSNKLGCCNNTILIEYNQLNCNTDSVRIHNIETTSVKKTIYQFCKRTTLSGVPNYSKVRCIKTIQWNTYPNGEKLKIEQHFGFEIGLIYRQETRTSSVGKVLTRETQKLVSHIF